MNTNRFFERISNNWPVKILSVTAAILIFLFYRMAMMEERFFSIPLDVQIDEQFMPADDYPKTVRVTIKGRSEEINLVLEENLSAYADFTDYTEEGEYTEPVRIGKEGAVHQLDPLEIHVEPRTITLSLEKKLSKSVEVDPSIVGYPAKGYELAQHFLTPSTVEIEGIEKRIRDLEVVETENIDITGRREDFTVRVRLKEPTRYSTFPGGDTVEFFGIVQEKTILQTVEDVDLIAIDLDEQFEVEGIPESNSLQVQGKQPVMEEYSSRDYRLTFDCSEIEEPGTYTIDVSPDVPQGVLVLSYEPRRVTVEVSGPGEEDS
ncbi:MAG: YbbR-like domain-containing protein [Spirochaetaceae bacterium]